MKVILEQDVKGQGKKGDVINVSDGYARNYLFPHKLASPADAAAVNAANIQKSAAAHRRFEAGLKAREDAKKLDGAVVTVKVRIGENGRMFGAVTGKAIAAALQEQRDLAVDRKKISVEPILSTGEYTARASLFENVSANFRVLVVEAD